MHPFRPSRPALLAAALAAGLACSDVAPEPVPLGPVDGHDLPRADLGRVAVGEPPPDFSLESYEGGVVTLSDFRGEKDVILVFYRGHW